MKKNQFKVDIPTPTWRKITAFINIVLITFYTCLPGTVAAYELISDSFIEADLNNSPQYQASTNRSFLFEKSYYVEDSTSESSTDIATFHQRLVDSRKVALAKPLMIPIMNGDITIIFPHYPLNKVIGDSFVQARFIRSQVFNQLNRNLLSDSYSSEAAQIKALYNNAFEFSASTTKLFGNSLIQKDVDDFGQNFIWPEVRTINNQQVLVPIVHLTTETIDRLLVTDHTVEFNGGTVALNNITISSGEIRSKRGTFFNVANNLTIAEGARLAASGDLNLLVGGTLQNISGQISAQGNVKIIAGQYQQKTMVHRFATPNSQGTRLGEIASVNSVTGDVSIKSMGDISIKGGTVEGNNIALQANGNIMLSSQETTYTSSGVVSGWDESESSLTQLQSHLGAKESISLMAAGAIEISATTLHAENGTIEILAGQGVYILDAADNFQSSRSGKFGNTTIEEKKFQSIAVRSALNAGQGIVIATEFGDINLRATELTSTTGTDIRANNGAVNFLMTKEQETYFYNKVKEGFWKIKTVTQEDNVETAVYNQIIGGVKVHATKGLTIELAQYENGSTQQNGQDTESARISADIQAVKSQISTAQNYGQDTSGFEAQLANLSVQLLQAQLGELAKADSSLAWMQDIHNDPQYQDNFNIAYKELVEIHKFDKTSNLSPAAMAIIAIAVAVAMGPAGFGALGAVSAAGGPILGPALQAGLLSITTQAATGLASGQGLEETVKSLHRSDSIKATVTAMVTAGVMNQLQGSFEFFDNIPEQDFSTLNPNHQLQTIANQATQAIGDAAVRTSISTVINGGDLGSFKDAFKASLIQSAVDAIGQSMADAIANAANGQDWALVFKYAAHAGAGCIVGELSDAAGASNSDRGCATGALGAITSAIVSDVYEAQKQDEINKLLSDERAALTQQRLELGNAGLFTDIAKSNSNIYRQKMADLQTAGVDLSKLGSALMAAATKLDVNLAVNTGGYTTAAETQHYVYALIDVIDDVNRSVFANQIIDGIAIPPIEPISIELINNAKSLGLNIYTQSGAIVYEDELGRKFNIQTIDDIEKITAYAENLRLKLIVLQDRHAKSMEAVDAIWQKFDDAQKAGYLSYIEGKMQREAGYEEIDLRHIALNGNISEVLGELFGVGANAAMMGLPGLIAFATGGDMDTPLVNGMKEDAAASVDASLGLEQGTTLTAINYTLLGRDLFDLGHLTVAAVKGSVALKERIQTLTQKRDTEGLSDAETLELADAQQQNEILVQKVEQFKQAEVDYYGKSHQDGLNTLLDSAGYAMHPSGFLQGPHQGFFRDTGIIDSNTGMPILQRIGKKADGSPDITKPTSYLTTDPNNSYKQIAANKGNLPAAESLVDINQTHKSVVNELANLLDGQGGVTSTEIKTVSDSVLGARSDVVVTGGANKAFNVPENQYAYRVEFTGEYKTKNGHQVPIYTETRVNVITLDDKGNGVGSAILEIKTGFTSKLTDRQAINYSAAINGCGKLCGNKSTEFQITTSNDKAPTVVYIIRDTKI